ncbi:Uncharacterized protein OS=Candidatus Thiomargarita nelsonii GN=OT06_08810 PE=4 SV=1: Asp_protease_2 [Gemmata massiliana]|uniref:Peptidase A2 domain-containing protein n=1 Tax=Gemmata massiliana TaxID=1210884 RepID=A0A6P2DJ55_9BACT|nr:retropepsin-like aspartic protease [Gemmata massiliana]VTS02207.1 Uncharacterized protein OS=Candidatus Thiomargarita nelsonii GN=OT06_08810 PE=4 SV=1: Asp_protease_2 [Gemmata massiliana]
MSESFDPRGRLVVVPAILTGPAGAFEFRFAVDTAATRSSVSSLILTRLGYTAPPEAERLTVRTGSGATRAGMISVSLLRALGQTRTNHSVLWLPHPPGSLIDGLLGLDFFRGLVLTLDFARGRVALDALKRWWQFWH